MDNFDLKIWTMDREVFSGKAFRLKAKALDGEFEILPNHINYINGLKDGIVEFSTDGGKKNQVKISSGFVKVDKNAVHLFVNE